MLAVTTIAASLFAVLPVTTAGAVTALPTDLTLLMRGGGWGHGHGMGQYGARAQAEAGKTWREILHSYYTGVDINKVDGQSLRVLVSTGSSVIVGGPESYTAKFAGGTKIATNSATYPYMRVRVTADGVAVDRGGSPTGPWNNIALGTKSVYFYPAATDPLMPVVFGSKLQYYRGYIKAYRRSDTTMYAVNHLSMDRYLYGVVPREMPASWHSVGLRAQAVAARSYSAWKKSNASSTASYDICATTQCQVYGGYGYRSAPTASITKLENARTNEAVDVTSGYTMLSAGAPIFAEFHSSSGGHTSQGSRSYLAPVADPWDATYSPYNRWDARVKVSEVNAKWPAIGQLSSIKSVVRDGDGPWGGRVESLTLVGTASSLTVSGSAFRNAFSWPSHGDGIRSTLFSTPGVYDSDLVSAPTEVTLAPGATKTITVTLKNTGTRSWPVGDVVRLGTWDPKDRTSVFAAPSWSHPTRASYVTADLGDGGAYVQPGDVGSFTFTLAAPVTASSGLYNETFRPVAAGLTWFGDAVSIPVRVAFGGASHLGANLLANPSFEAASASVPSGWTPVTVGSSDGRVGGGIDGKAVLKLVGDPSLTKTYRQALAISGKARDRLIVSTWNRAIGTSTAGGVIEALVKLKNADGTTSSFGVAFPESPHAWTHREKAFITTKDFSSADVTLNVRNQTGTAYFDRIRLERNDVRAGSFEPAASTTDLWTMVNATTSDGRDGVVARTGNASLRVRGRDGVNAYARQVVALAGPAGDAYRVTGWNRSVATTAAGGLITVRAKVRNTDGTTQQVDVEFPRGAHGWGYGERVFKTAKAYERIDLFAKVEDQSGTVWFDEIALARVREAKSLSGNFGFELGSPAPGDWTLVNTSTSAVATSASVSGDASLHLDGVSTENIYARQYLPLAGEAGDTFRLSGYSKTVGSSTGGGPVRIWARIKNADGTTSNRVIDFSRAPHNWTRKELLITTSKPYVRIDVFSTFAEQTGDAWFDSVRLEPITA